MVVTGQQVGDATPRHIAHLGVGMMCGDRELHEQVVDVQLFAEVLALEQLRVGAV
ncbi:hypothetical protein [Curtobacterium sp. MCBD17_003]|uniref:hypothetical protein n=1 Tax=Curtobacterium sp. MCBD17_003 TaxID=2175667 RepID=UPI0015E87BA9|nr:hypothetical protein [Curtobacterium sp. MCBD17_003]WIE53985.1 hypothetical protein DEI88_012780 [Curtobacterium sp. MCBD17_003]